tara:strand:- start:3615 stop:3926 length:312 start_codon:yes stop_codon:yes gene_type:complete
MNGKLEPEERVMDPPSIAEQISKVIEKLDWQCQDNIVVEIGGTVISGIHQGENYNKKWSTPYGVRKYNKDAFIIISNESRRDLSKSQPMDREHKPHHSQEVKK